MKSKGIMAYGTDEDRAKLAVLAHVRKLSQSEYLINHIRETYRAIYDDTDPVNLKIMLDR